MRGQGEFEYRVRYRREFGKEKARTYGRLGAARRSLQRIKNYESADPMFPAERLLYATIDRRSVGEWDKSEVWDDRR